MEEQLKIIKERRNPLLQDKEATFRLISDSYAGGERFRKGGHLFRYYRESQKAYDERLRRSEYINYVQPLVDTLAGFISDQPPDRSQVPEYLSFLSGDVSKGRGMQAFMQSLTTLMMLHPVLVLVDNKRFPDGVIRSKADEVANKITPYAVVYFPWEIRDFALADNGALEWVLLDNSFIDVADPMKKATRITEYRLWTKQYYQDFTFEKDDSGVESGEASEQYPHSLGLVPAVIGGWKSASDNLIDSSVMEGVALLARAIYNTLSSCDEMITGSSFSTLFFPTKAGDTEFLADIKTEGIAELLVVPFDGDLSHKPAFDSPQSGSTQTYFDLIRVYLRELFRQVGMAPAEDNAKYMESGAAKSVEFRKTEALLRLIATQLQHVEESIYRFASLWMGRGDVDVSVQYPTDFQEDDVDQKLDRLYRAFSLPYSSVQKAAARRVVDRTFADLTDEERMEIEKEIKTYLESRVTPDLGDGSSDAGQES